MKKNKKKIFVSGNFNVLHPGHINLLKFAKNLGDKLIVGVISKKIAKVDGLNSDISRVEILKSINFIDKVLIVNNSLEKTLIKEKPNIIVKGKEHEIEDNIENEILKKIDAKIIFNSGRPNSSYYTSFLKNDTTNIKIQKKFLKDHKMSPKNLLNLVKKFSKLKVLVIGDLILDEYISCLPIGMSHEDPTIVLNPTSSKKFIGGAGIVAAHSASLGAQVNLISVVGKDSNRYFSKKKLDEYSVNHVLITDNVRPTILKQRFITKNKTHLKVSFLNQSSIDLSIQKKILSNFRKLKSKIDLLVFADFNYGCLPQTLVEQIIHESKNEKILITADSQSSSQVGNILRFKSLDLITPTEREGRIALQNNDDGLIILADKLKNACSSKNIILTLGSSGILMYDDSTDRDRLPTFNLNPIDVAGSGDSLYITAAMTLALKGNIWSAGYLGSLAASVQSDRIGNIPINARDLSERIKKL